MSIVFLFLGLYFVFVFIGMTVILNSINRLSRAGNAWRICHECGKIAVEYHQHVDTFQCQVCGATKDEL